MGIIDTPERWTHNVQRSFDTQVAKGINQPVLPEYLLWATPGGECFDLLRELGLKIVPIPPYGTFIEPTGETRQQG